MLMGIAGPELWRTSTLSTKPHQAGFGHVSADWMRFRRLEVTCGALLMVKMVQMTGSAIILFFFFFLFLRFENRGAMILSSVSMLINLSASMVLLQTLLSNMRKQQCSWLQVESERIGYRE